MTTQAQFIWLLRHEYKLLLRAAPNSKWLWWAGFGFVAIGVLSAFLLRQFANLLPSVSADLPTGVLLVFSLVLLFLLSIMVSVAISSSVQMLFERGDLDLLLSSPLDTRLVLASRGVWLAISCFFSVAVFVIPIMLVAVVFIGFQILGVLPLLIALSLVAAGIGLVLTLTLVRLLGARRARTVAQVLGAVFGASMYLTTQGARFVNQDNLPWLADFFASLGKLEPTSFLFTPAKAILFDPIATALMLLFGIAVFLSSVQFTYRFFLRGATASVLGGKVKPPKTTTAFAGSLGLNVFRKEWRLVLRDPMLISQTLLQLMYLIPMLLPFFASSSRSGRNGFDLATLGTYPLLVIAAVLAGGSLAQNITQIMVGAEDAAELIKMSPIASSRVRYAKLFAALLPIWILFVPLIVWRGILEPKHFFILIGFAAVTILGGLMILWTAKPFARSDFKQNTRKQPWLVGFALFFLSAAWCAALLIPLWLPFGWGLLSATFGLGIPYLTFFLTKGNSSLGY